MLTLEKALVLTEKIMKTAVLDLLQSVGDSKIPNKKCTDKLVT